MESSLGKDRLETIDKTRAIYFDCDGEGANTYQLMFKVLKKYDIPLSTLSYILRIFDENIREISMKDEHNFRLKFEGDQSRDQIISDKELYSYHPCYISADYV